MHVQALVLAWLMEFPPQASRWTEQFTSGSLDLSLRLNPNTRSGNKYAAVHYQQPQGRLDFP